MDRDRTYEAARSLLDASEHDKTNMVLFVYVDGTPRVVTNMSHSSEQLAHMHQFVTDTLKLVGERYGN